MSEVRIVDPLTGGEKGAKLARFSLIPAEWLWALAEHYGIGAKKYADRNWERGYKWSLSLDAHSRHLNAWLLGETYDEETGSNHLIAAAWHLIALFIFARRNVGTDDIRRTASSEGLSGITLPESGTGEPGVTQWNPQTDLCVGQTRVIRNGLR